MTLHDDVIKWKHFPRYWPFVRGNHRSPVNSPHKGQWRGALMLSLISAWINSWVNNREAGNQRRHRAHYDFTVMIAWMFFRHCWPFVKTSLTYHKGRSFDIFFVIGLIIYRKKQLHFRWFNTGSCPATSVNEDPATKVLHNQLYIMALLFMLLPCVMVQFMGVLCLHYQLQCN